MRFWLVVAVTGSLAGMASPALAGCNLSAPDAAHAGGDPCVRPWLDANMHINQLQFVGTAESYKLAPSDAMLSNFFLPLATVMLIVCCAYGTV